MTPRQSVEHLIGRFASQLIFFFQRVAYTFEQLIDLPECDFAKALLNERFDFRFSDFDGDDFTIT